MIIVLSIFSIFLFYTVFFTEDPYEKFLLIIPVFLLSIYTGTRMDVGGYDYHVYKYFYELPYYQNPYKYEYFFVLLRNFSKFLGLNYNFFLLFLSFVFNFIIYKLFISYSKYPTFSFLIYLCTFYYWHNFTIIRNFIAIVIFWISLKYIIERKLILYILLITLACFFHKTAVILYPFYFLLNNQFTKKSLSLLLVFALVVNPLTFIIFKANISFLGLSERLNRYSHIVEHGNPYELLELLILVFILLFYLKNSTKRENVILNLNIFALFIFIAFYRFAIFLRVLDYFRLGVFIGIPFIISNISNKYLKYLSFILLCSYLTFKYYDTVTAYTIYNYKTWLI